MNCPRRLLSSSEFNFLHPYYWFGDTDARPLGLFRIAFAALMLKEAIYHIFVAEIWFSDAGLLPLRLLPRISPNTPTLMSGLNDTWMAVGFFVIWAVVAFLLLIGWQTRVMSLLNLILLVSVINRNELVVTGADGVMQSLAFWSLFVPLGRCYSLDARRRPTQKRPTTYAFPVRMLQLQIALIYIFTTLFKLEGQTWQSGDALYMAMQVRMHTFPIAEWLLVHATIGELRILTHIALFIEGAFAILVFAPFGQPFLRRAGLIAGVILHVGIGVVMNVPNFPLIMMLSYFTLLDSVCIEWIDQQITILIARARAIFRRPAPPPKPRETPSPVRKGCLGALMMIPQGMLHGAYRGSLAVVLSTIMGFIIWGSVLANDHFAMRLNIPAMPAVVETNFRVIGLWQSWAMFAPDPLNYEGWFGINGIFPGSIVYDLRNKNGRPHWYLGPEARWGKLEENLMTKDKDDPIFIAWAASICRQHRAEGMTGVQIALYSRATSPPGQAFLPYLSTVIRGATCQ